MNSLGDIPLDLLNALENELWLEKPSRNVISDILTSPFRRYFRAML